MSTEMQIVTVSTVNLPDAIRQAYADYRTARHYLLLAHRDEAPAEVKTISKYAYARAAYREGRGLLIDYLALIADCSEEKIMHFAKKLLKIEATEDTFFSNNECSQIMSAMMDMSAA